MMKQQTFFPRNIATQNISLISTMGLDHPEGDYFHHPEWTHYQFGNEWLTRQVSRHENFSLMVSECRRAAGQSFLYTQWEDYIKITFTLTGNSTTILDGYGEFEHGRPEVFITSGPPDMMKIDMSSGGYGAGICLCLRRGFFTEQMGLAPDELPEPLRTIVLSEVSPYCFHRLALKPDLAAATRAVLATPIGVRRRPIYSQAKAVELMCLLLGQMATEGKARSMKGRGRRSLDSQLREARELLTQSYAEGITIDQLSRKVGLNRAALTSGFRQLFGMSVFDCLQKERMSRACELLQNEAYSIAEVAETVGYSHACTFATAFRGYYGYSPRKARGSC